MTNIFVTWFLTFLILISFCGNCSTNKTIKVKVKTKGRNLHGAKPELACEVVKISFLNRTQSPLGKPFCSIPPNYLPNGRFKAGTTPRAKGLLPPWMDLTLAREGQQFAVDYLSSISLGQLFGFTIVLTFPDFYDLLLMTHKSDTPEHVVYRYVATGTHIRLWYETFLTGKNDSVFLSSIATIRNLHLASAALAKQLQSENEPLVGENEYANVTLDKELWTAFDTDLRRARIKKNSRKFPDSFYKGDGLEVPVNQFQFGMTQYAFVGLPILYPEAIGINASDSQLWAFNHLWAVLGYALGIEDYWNIALQPDLSTTKDYYQMIFDDFFIPTLFDLKFINKVLLEAYLKGFEMMYPNLSPRVQLYRLLTHVVNIPAPNLRRRFTHEEEKFEINFETEHLPKMLTSKEYRLAMNKDCKKLDEELGRKYYGGEYDDPEYRAQYVSYS